MADFKVTMTGLEDLTSKMNQLVAFCNDRVDKVLDESLNRGKAYAIANLKHIDTGETRDSIDVVRRKGSKRGVIKAGGAAIWIEFGTGVARNSGNTHPMVVDSSVPIYPHGGYGKGHGKNPNGWYYIDPKDGKLHHTKGIEQNMFMYHTYEQLVDELPEIAKEVFSK